MSTGMTMNAIIHAAFRRDLRRFDQALRDFPPDSQRRADELAAAWDNLAYQLHQHHHDEEVIFWPTLRSLGIDDTLVGQLEGEHAQMLDALSSATTSMEALRADPSDSSARAARGEVGNLESVLTGHLAHEERDMEPRSLAFHATPQFKAAQKRVRRAHRGNQGTLFAWLLDGADIDARRGLRREIPPPVVFVIRRVGGRRYLRNVAPVWV